jgi:hypothetical protein
MVQAAPRPNRQASDDPEARLQEAIRIVDELPTAMLPRLVNHVMDTISQQLEADQLPRNGSNAMTTPHEVENAIDDDEEQVSGYDLVIAGGGPMAEVARLLKRGNLTDEEQQRMKELAYEAVVSRPPANEPPPTIEEAKEMLRQHRMEKYGR